MNEVFFVPIKAQGKGTYVGFIHPYQNISGGISTTFQYHSPEFIDFFKPMPLHHNP